MVNMMTYDLLARCIRSGQLTDAEIAEHMRDEVFARWYTKHYG